ALVGRSLRTLCALTSWSLAPSRLPTAYSNHASHPGVLKSFRSRSITRPDVAHPCSQTQTSAQASACCVAQPSYIPQARTNGLHDLYGAFPVKGFRPRLSSGSADCAVGLLTVLCSEREGRSSSRRLRSGSRSARKGSRDRNASGARRLAA